MRKPSRTASRDELVIEGSHGARPAGRMGRRRFLAPAATVIAPLALSPTLLAASIEGPAKLSLVDVRAFGARGDGAADDAPAIQAAVDSLPTFSQIGVPFGGVVYLPPGTYRLLAPLRMPPRVRLTGAGEARTILESAIESERTAVVDFTGAGPGREIYAENGVENLSIFVRAGVVGSIGIRWSGGSGGVLRHVRIVGGAYGISATPGSGPGLWQHLTMEQNDVGISLNQCRGIVIQAPRLFDQSTAGMRIRRSSGITLCDLAASRQPEGLDIVESQVSIRGAAIGSDRPVVTNRVTTGLPESNQVMAIASGGETGPSTVLGSSALIYGLNTLGQTIGRWNIGGAQITGWRLDPAQSIATGRSEEQAGLFSYSLGDSGLYAILDSDSDPGVVDRTDGGVYLQTASMPGPAGLYAERRRTEKSLIYRFNVGAGDYLVRLHMVAYPEDPAASRAAVLLNGQARWEEFSVAEEAGGPLRVLVPQWFIRCADYLSVELRSTAGVAAMAGLEIYRQG